AARRAPRPPAHGAAPPLRHNALRRNSAAGIVFVEVEVTSAVTSR
ncbi:MAG: hypothetical protein JWQ48_3258, partial [Conexibacter sp.]|nr:hypothetical protein [Conexibacter sp.]